MAGYVAFSVLLAMFPFVVVAGSLAGLIVGQAQSVGAVTSLVELLPPGVAETIEPVLVEVAGANHGEALTLSALIALWSAASGVEAFRASFERAYGVKDPRPWWLSRLISIGIVLLGVVTFVVVGVAIVAAPLLILLTEDVLGRTVPGGSAFLRYGLGLGVFLVFLLSVHRFLPRWRAGRRLWPGILVTTVLWFAGATAFSVYLAYAPSFTVTYGTMAGVVVTMLFLYLTGVVIIFGAEINANLDGDQWRG